MLIIAVLKMLSIATYECQTINISGNLHTRKTSSLTNLTKKFCLSKCTLQLNLAGRVPQSPKPMRALCKYTANPLALIRVQ
ncbi:hypothetical protein V1527DRAFT_476606 [Lipomyces starkeyi]